MVAIDALSSLKGLFHMLLQSFNLNQSLSLKHTYNSYHPKLLKLSMHLTILRMTFCYQGNGPVASLKEYSGNGSEKKKQKCIFFLKKLLCGNVSSLSPLPNCDVSQCCPKTIANPSLVEVQPACLERGYPSQHACSCVTLLETTNKWPGVVLHDSLSVLQKP